MKKTLLRKTFRWIAAASVPALLPCCAPQPQSVAYGENVSYYFSSEFACPERVPEWRGLGEAGASFEEGPQADPGDASDAFGKALATLGQRSREAMNR